MARSRPAAYAEEDGGSLAGNLLVAMPALEDPRFARSVILLCAHSPEAAMGIVINRPLARPTFDEILRQHSIAPLPPARSVRVCSGGPVEDGRGFVLHTADWTSDGTLFVTDDLALTASLDVLKAFAEGRGPRAGVLALGYAGWGPGQLDREMQRNTWLSVPSDERLVFDSDTDTKWRRSLAKLRIDPLLLSGEAGHA